jgi:hypothetical protein
MRDCELLCTTEAVATVGSYLEGRPMTDLFLEFGQLGSCRGELQEGQFGHVLRDAAVGAPAANEVPVYHVGTGLVRPLWPQDCRATGQLPKGR